MVIEMIGLKTDSFKCVCRYLPEHIRSVLVSLDEEVINDICEIRLKADMPVVIVFTDKICFITTNGRITGFPGSDLIVSGADDIKDIFSRMCRYSVYSHNEDICNGFVTIENGCRVGVYGTAVIKQGKISSVRNIKGLNIRVAGAFYGVADSIAEIFKKEKVNMLICGPPSSGKTTFLKDLCVNLSDKCFKKTVVIDERSEFDDYYVGCNTDVLSSYPKDKGIEIAVRTLSPDIVVCDELGNVEEINKILEGLNSGVNFIMSIHCASYAELLKKEQFKLLYDKSVIDYCVFLKKKSEVGSVMCMRGQLNEDNCIDLPGNCVCFNR